jgi:hypothetical protein
VRLGAQEGQSLIIVVAAMFVVLAFSAFAIDLAQWYQKHHQSQVSADASALAAANCLARRVCTSVTPNGDAASTASAYATKNGVTIPSGDISFDSTNDKVTVTTATVAPVSFAGIVGSHPTIAATAVASWAGGQVPYSFFSANTDCATGGANPLGIWVNDNGGGNSTIFGMYADGQFYNNNDSGSAYYDGQVSSSSTCGGGEQSHCQAKSTAYGQNCWEGKNTDLNSAPAVLYPTCYAEPGVTTTPASITSNCQIPPTGSGPICDYAPDGYWTTDSATVGTTSPDLITGPPPSGEAYCVGNGTPGSSSTAPATTASGGCSLNSDGTAGSIYIGSSLPGTGYEFAGPCIVFSLSGNTNVSFQPPANQPLVYGTANTQSSGTPDVYISTPSSGTTSTSMGTVFDPLGSVWFAGNNAFLGFIEAMNIQVTANNSVNGTGPIASNMPGGDFLSN